MVRNYRLKGSKSFLVWAILLLLLGLWAVRDGWFPSENTLTRHPPDSDRHFYQFNKSLALLCLVGAAICGYIHWVIR